MWNLERTGIIIEQRSERDDQGEAAERTTLENGGDNVDLGIGGKFAIVCGASAGLGFAIADALAHEGVTVFIAARNAPRLNEAAAQIEQRAPGRVRAVLADVTREEGRNALLAACPNPDILVNNAAGPPPGNFREWSEEQWVKALGANMLSPIMFMRAVIDGMIERRYGRILNITSIAVKQPDPSLGMSNGARAGLTGFVSGLAREVARHNVTINNILPGRFDTDRLRATQQYLATQNRMTLTEVREAATAAIPASRFGSPPEFGQLCAYLSSAHASFITGQNILIDGGEFRGLL